MYNLSEFISKLEKNSLSYKAGDMEALFTPTQTCVMLTIIRGGRKYEYPLKDMNEAFYIYRQFEKGKITAEDLDRLRINVKGLRGYRLNHKSTAAMITLIVLGLAIMIAFGVMFSIGILAARDKDWTFLPDDLALLIILLSGVYCGLSVILYACGFPVYESLHFVGAIMIGIGIGTTIYSFEDLRTDGVMSFLEDLFIVGLFGGFGLLIFSLSFEKAKKNVVTIKRTPVLPGNDQLTLIRDRVFENKKTLTLSIHPSDAPVYLTGSRIGGIPYSDDKQSLPESWDERRLVFLMQINLSEIDYTGLQNLKNSEKPENPLPRKGLLQFYTYDRNGNNGQVRALYYPDFNEMNFYNGHDSQSIKITPSMQPDAQSISLSDFYTAASELNIPLADDLEAQDLYDCEIFKVSAGDYLLGPKCYYPPKTELSLGDETPDRPLLMLNYDSPLLDIFEGKMEFDSFQTFISENRLKHHDFTNLETIIDVDYPEAYRD